MNVRQVRLIQESYAQLLPNAGLMTDLFYPRLFQVEPALRLLFPEDMSQQKLKLINMLTFVVDSLMQLDELIPTVQALGVRHHGYGVLAEHYPPLGAALIWALEQSLGEQFTPELRAAWTSVYTLLANTMLQISENE